ncbi:MAG: glutamate decarboxylase [Bacteroidota bacterium]
MKPPKQSKKLDKRTDSIAKSTHFIDSNNFINQELLSEHLAQRPNEIPDYGSGPKAVRKIIHNHHLLDFNPELNTASYVNVMFEEEEEEVALMGLKVNLADQTVYPESYKIHDRLVNMIAHLWNCPEPKDLQAYGVYPGACTVGSTEACLLAGLALKFRWRNWFAKRHQLDKNEVLKEQPNIVISTCYQAAWEKLFKYMDVGYRFIQPSSKTFTMDPAKIYEAVDEHTIGVVAIMGNHYAGQYDPIWEINEVVEDINQKKGYQIGIHVDAASGGFIAPFQKALPPWDFRLKNVLSISASGHKYGVSCCGTGWVIWRERKNLSEHVAVSMTYLGGKIDSYTLNFSRPASGVYVQYYKFLRYGIEGYRAYTHITMSYAKEIQAGLAAMTYKGKPRFIMLNQHDNNCLPVVAAMLNPACRLSYNCIDLQHALSQHHWYVAGYEMVFNDPLTGKKTPLLSDQSLSTSMFRIVVKNNISATMVQHLLDSFKKALELLDSIDFNSNNVHTHLLRHKDQIVTNHC